MYVAILGRQPALGIAELERLYGDVHWFSSHSALFTANSADVTRLGGSLKLGRVVFQTKNSASQLNNKIVRHYIQYWKDVDKKITLGISDYSDSASPRGVQRLGLTLKKQLKSHDISLRLIPNQEAALSTATSHHNKLGLSDNKVELLIIKGKNGSTIVAESIGAQNITALAARDQGRPKRDAFVGMLPPKLAQIMVNLATGRWKIEDRRLPGAKLASALPSETSAAQATPDAGAPAVAWREAVSGGSGGDGSARPLTILDPFCGTGVILQEAALLGFNVYGTDLSDKMIDYSRTNLDWLAQTHHTDATVTLHQGDAMKTTWQSPIDVVACETYLGQPFSAPPSPAKLREVRGNCNHIISQFLTNIGTQLAPDTPLCIAVPAWKDIHGNFTHLPLIDDLEKLGYRTIPLTTVKPSDLLYYRDDQVVARELLVLEKL